MTSKPVKVNLDEKPECPKKLPVLKSALRIAVKPVGEKVGKKSPFLGC
jgi:hypothetical protein